jgi:hypothetical protein
MEIYVFCRVNFRQVLFEIIDSGLVEDFQITFVKNFIMLIFSTEICKMHLTKLVTYLLLKLNYFLRFNGTFPLIRILRSVNLYKLDVLVKLVGFFLCIFS